jgi:DNA-binding transcriptional LysR family regulator
MVRAGMEKLSQRVAAKMEQPVGMSLVERVSWDDLRDFIVVARTLNFRKAATALKTSSSTILRRMERLEETLGFRLFDRLPDGLGLTAEGRSVYATAQEMQRASHTLRAHLDQDLTTRGTVRCAVTEGLGTMWVLPHLVNYNRAHPSTVVELRCSMELVDVLRMEADVAIQLTQPERADVKSARLGRMHIYPFAARSYADIYGLPTNLEEVARHRFIDQRGPQIDETAAARVLNMPSIEGIVALRTNSSTAHFQAIELGLGIGALPTYAIAFAPELIPVDIGVQYPVDVWIAYHPDARSVRRVASFIDWLRTLFDANRYPWFSDEFIHPRELARLQTAAAAKGNAFRLPSAMRAPKTEFGP